MKSASKLCAVVCASLLASACVFETAGSSPAGDGPDTGDPAADPELSPLPPQTSPDSAPTPIRDGRLQWVRGFAGIDDDVARDVAVGEDGAIAFTGWFFPAIDFGGGEIRTANGNDAAHVVLTPEGGHFASSALGGSGNHFGFTIAAQGNGASLIAGGFTDEIRIGDALLEATGAWDGFVASVDRAGNRRWARALHGDSMTHVFAVASTPDGGAVVAGGFRGTTDLGGGPLRAVGDDSFVARYAADGSHMWSRRFGGDDDDATLAIAMHSTASGGDRIAIAGIHDGASFVAALDGDGADLWYRWLGIPADEPATRIGFLPSGALIAAYARGDNASADVVVERLTSTGATEWARVFTGPGNNVPYGLAITPAGEIVVAGSFEQTIDVSGTQLVSAGGSDAFASKLDARGGLVWTHSYGGAGDDSALSAAATADSGVIVVGTYETAADFGAGALPVAGGSEMFAMKLAR
jgi:hypothetical protein